jgi:hypothetical protein
MLFDGMAMRIGSAEAVDMSLKASAIAATKTFSNSHKLLQPVGDR